MKRIVTIQDTTGHVIGQWNGGDNQMLDLVAGRTHRTLAEGDTTDYSGQRWTGEQFEAVPAPRVTPNEAATAEAQRQDIIATCALAVMHRDRVAWNAMTSAQKLDAVRQEVALWKGLRVFLHDQTL